LKASTHPTPSPFSFSHGLPFKHASCAARG
jgi:hypothetical protein